VQIPQELLERLRSDEEPIRHAALRELASGYPPHLVWPLISAARDDPSRTVRFLARDLIADLERRCGGEPVAPDAPGGTDSPAAASRAVWLLFSFRGRATRAEFWVGLIATHVILVVPLIYLPHWFYGSPLEPVVALVTNILFAWWLLAVSVKRWHDLDRSGWWVLIYAAFCVGALWAFVVQGFRRGSADTNRFGPPRGASPPAGGEP
jgi:uncharacterized membrane protein YhaH (DUF805 family)